MESAVYFRGTVTVVAVALVIIGISIPLILRKVPRNVVYGIRTRTTLSDDAIWYDANAYGGWAMTIAALVSIVTIVIVKDAGLEPLSFLHWSIGILVVPQAIAIVLTLAHIRKP